MGCAYVSEISGYSYLIIVNISIEYVMMFIVYW